MTAYRNIAAKIRGAFAANHNTRPGDVDMASISKIAPKAQPDHATIHWLNTCIERGRHEIFTDRVLVVPGVAAELLRRNPDNRNISAVKAEHYARDMAAGRWAENGETVIVSQSGELNDGQHRMQAVIDSNSVIPFLFVFGVPRETRITVDQGAARGAGDYLSMLGIQYARNAGVATKFIIAFERSGGKSISARGSVTNAEVVARVRADGEIIKSAAFAHHSYQSYRSLFSHSVMTACHYILAEIDASDANDYLTQIALGENIKRGDPAFAVRQAFLSDKRERQDAMEVIFHGWNAYREGRPLKIAKCFGTLPALV